MSLDVERVSHSEGLLQQHRKPTVYDAGPSRRFAPHRRLTFSKVEISVFLYLAKVQNHHIMPVCQGPFLMISCG